MDPQKARIKIVSQATTHSLLPTSGHFTGGYPAPGYDEFLNKVLYFPALTHSGQSPVRKQFNSPTPIRTVQRFLHTQRSPFHL